MSLSYKNINENWLRNHIANGDYIDWLDLSTNVKLSEKFIRDFKDKVYWEMISKRQVLSEDFIREFKDKVEWSSISRCQILSEDFIIEFIDYVNLPIISSYQLLSEEFITNHKDSMSHCWYSICKYQFISGNFINENINLISLEVGIDELHIYNRVTENFIRKFSYEIKSNRSNNSRYYPITALYPNLSTETLKLLGISDKVINRVKVNINILKFSTLFELHENYLIGYVYLDIRGTDSYNQKINLGVTYDYYRKPLGEDIYENDGGLELVDSIRLKCRVMYNDIIAVVGNNKIKARRIKPVIDSYNIKSYFKSSRPLNSLFINSVITSNKL